MTWRRVWDWHLNKSVSDYSHSYSYHEDTDTDLNTLLVLLQLCRGMPETASGQTIQTRNSRTTVSSSHEIRTEHFFILYRDLYGLDYGQSEGQVCGNGEYQIKQRRHNVTKDTEWQTDELQKLKYFLLWSNTFNDFQEPFPAEAIQTVTIVS